MDNRCWNDLPAPCLQAISEYIRSPADAAASRLVCTSWAKDLPLTRISLSLVPDSKACSQFQHQHSIYKRQRLLESLQQPASAARHARECVLTVPMDGTCGIRLAFSTQNQHNTACHTAEQSNWALTAVTALLPQLPKLRSITIRTSGSFSRHNSSGVGSPAAQALLVNALQPLLLQPQLQDRLQHLTLNLSSWPAPSALSELLLQLPALRSFSLQRCPVSVICSLPSLPRLQKLSISGLLQEPVPASYSYKRGPLLPSLPQLHSLVLHSMPLDLRVQELEGIEAAQEASARQQLQMQQQSDEQAEQRQLLKLLQAGMSASAAKASIQNARRSTGNMLHTGQWIGSSVVQQCPQLRELCADFELGPVVLGLKQLTVLHGVHPVWLSAAAGAASHTSGATLSHQLLQLRHLGIGVAVQSEHHVLMRLCGLKSIVLWPSSSCIQGQQAAAEAAAVAAQNFAVQEEGMCATRAFVVGGAWSLSADELQQLLEKSNCSTLWL